MRVDDILQKAGLKYEDLNATEKETLYSMLESVQKASISIDKFRDYFRVMRDSVETELINEPEFTRILFFKFENRKQIYLKARLRNYMLIESFLDSPKRAKEALERAISGIVRK